MRLPVFIQPNDPRRLDVAVAKVSRDFPDADSIHFLRLRQTFVAESLTRIGPEQEILLAHAAACALVAAIRTGVGMPCLGGRA